MREITNKEKTLSKVPASFVIYVLCFPAFLLLLVSLPFKLICCLSQFVASSKVILLQKEVTYTIRQFVSLKTMLTLDKAHFLVCLLYDVFMLKLL